GLDRTFSGYANELYKFMLVDSRLPQSALDLLGGISYPLAKDTPGIQAADLLTNRLYTFACAKLASHNVVVPLLIKQLIKNRKTGQRIEILDKGKLKTIQKLAFQQYERLSQSGTIPDYLSALRRS